MQTWIALIRGINVGGRHIVPMKELRAALASHGYQNVRTYIQSGNVVYEHPGMPDSSIEEIIETHFHFTPDVFYLTEADFKRSAANCPFETDIGKTVHFFFCKGDTGQIDSELLEELRSATEEYALVENVFYLHAPDGIGRSKLVVKIDRAFKGLSTTGRNLNTINKIIQLID